MDDAILLRAIIDHAIDGIVIIDMHGRIQLVNPSLCKLFGYQENELHGEPVAKLMLENDAAHHQQYIARYLQSGVSGIIGRGREVTGRKKDGTAFSFRLAISEVKSGDKLVFAGIIQDLTVMKTAEEILRRHNEELELIVDERTKTLRSLISQLKIAQEDANRSLQREQEISRMKSRFVSMASHEFRSPLSSIQLSAALVERYYDRLNKEKVMVHLNKIKTSVSDLTATLDDFLSIEKIESGTVKLIQTSFDLAAFAAEVCEELSMMKKPGQTLVQRHTGAKQDCVLDRNLLKHCLVNLISNAIKYSGDEGLIEISTDIHDGRICISVRDYGIGIPDEDAERLFTAFFRAGNVRDIPGTGLGLNIVKKYTEMMNGTLSYIKPQAAGAEFQLCFPESIGNIISAAV